MTGALSREQLAAIREAVEERYRDCMAARQRLHVKGMDGPIPELCRDVIALLDHIETITPSATKKSRR